MITLCLDVPHSDDTVGKSVIMHVARVALPSVTATQSPPLSVDSRYSGSIVNMYW